MDAEVTSKAFFCRGCYFQLPDLNKSHMDSFWCCASGINFVCSQCGRRVYCGMDVLQYSKMPQVEIFRCGACQLVFKSKSSLSTHAGPPNHF
ncbi:hypothetical protein TNCV_2334761 [Trichonephila clavipes]|uniref:C2H2-type domain-containing protein n=1 Tax=Trichonephila clavipes TaxID=2585209 RepID=A0A8X6SQ68_TRICX|nr:hypothetical protein TNCV_2334761 [Trichonephila clavipes]